MAYDDGSKRERRKRRIQREQILIVAGAVIAVVAYAAAAGYTGPCARVRRTVFNSTRAYYAAGEAAVKNGESV